MISAVCWVPKGAVKNVPVVAEPPSQEEMEEALKTVTLETVGVSDDDENMDVDGTEEVDEVAQAKSAAEALRKGNADGSSGAVQDIADELRELDMDKYDDEEDRVEIFSTGVGDLFYPSNDMDPYLKNNNDEDEDEEEIEDMNIKPTDSMIVTAQNEDEMSFLQVLIFEEYEDGDTNMYVHHEVIIPEFPLCLAWMDCNLKGGEKGNFIAVGSMEPTIEIWDLDMVDEVQPHTVLGGFSKKKKEKGKKKKHKKGSHRDSVLGLAWNKEVRNVLASASADNTVKIWDVAAGKCAVTLEHHDDKVQAVAWSQHSPEVLLSGSFGKSVAMNDMKDGGQSCSKWSVEADVESLAWDPHNENLFVVSLENGMVQAFDKRTASSNSNSGSKPAFTLHAHEKAVSSISFGPSAPNLLATGSTDKMVKLWDISNNQPSCVASLAPKAGAIFSISFSNDSPFLLAIGGSKGKLQVWNTLTEPAIANKFGR